MSTFEGRLNKEIQDSGIDVDKLKDFIWGGKEELEYNRNIFEVVTNDPIASFKTYGYGLKREEMFKENLKRIARIKELSWQGAVPHVDMKNYGAFSTAYNSLFAVSVHHGMFESIVKVLGSDEQIEKYWDDIVAYKVLGCYAQTEIGHGSDVQNLQTEAVYDESTEEFVIHSPGIKAIKFWPGDMGKMANHAVVFARLIIKGESYGIHAFLIRIREDETHRTLKGIEVGDIGTKFGYFYKDNGYMKFDRVRVPRSAILSKYVNVSKDGMIELKGDPRIAYATMLWIRVQLLYFSWQILSINLASGIRYSSKRTQFRSLSNSKEERRIIDYQASQTKYVSTLAFTFANVFVAKFCMTSYHTMNERIQNDDFSMMNDLHVLISSLKAYYMDHGMKILYNIRELMGGHGYSAFSNIPGWIEAWSANVTLEGDGYVLYQQTTRKLLKIMKSVKKGKTFNK